MIKYFFLRDDDIRSPLDNNLIKLLELLIQLNIPISLAVEPANIDNQMSEWLLNQKERYPNLIEIIQHGYNHNLNEIHYIYGKTYKGEFGFKQSYSEQRMKILGGKTIMESNFGNKWFPAFSFPYGGRNLNSIKVLKDLNYKVVNGSYHYSLPGLIFDYLGRIGGKEYFLGRRVSWHLKPRFKSQLMQIDTSISVIKKFYNDNTDCEFYELEDLKVLTKKYLNRTNVIGIVLHHRYHNNNSYLILKNYLEWLKSIPNVLFLSQEDIYNKYRRY